MGQSGWLWTVFLAACSSASNVSSPSNVIDLELQCTCSADSTFVVAWGGAGNGGSITAAVQSELKSIVSIVGNFVAFAAISKLGKVTTWGASYGGGNSSLVATALEKDIVQVVTTDYAFATISKLGKVTTWGDSDRGGDSSSVASKLEKDIVQVVGNKHAFAAINKLGRVTTWGASFEGGDSSLVVSDLEKDIVLVVGNGGAFAAINKLGRVTTWGNSDDGGHLYGLTLETVKSIAATNVAFAALACKGSDNGCKCPQENGSPQYWDDGLKQCRRCIAVPYTVPNAALTACEPCEKSRYFNASSGTCVQCGHGTFQGTSPGYCQACGPGTFANVSHCEACPLGTYGNGTFPRTQCDTCGQGTVPDDGKTGCDFCPVGQFVDNSSKKCAMCPLGTVALSTKARTQCDRCGPGTIPNDAKTGCDICYAGYADQHECVLCSFGRKVSYQRDGCELDMSVVLPIIFSSVFIVLVALYCGHFLWEQHCARLSIICALKDSQRKDLGRLERLLTRGRKARLGIHVKDVEKQMTVLQNKYIDLEYIIQIVEECNLKFVQGDWMVIADMNRIMRQQDLPQEAFWSVIDFIRDLRMIDVVAISYCWLHPSHPDPAGHHLKIIRHAIQSRLTYKGPGQVKDIAVFFDYMSLPQNAETGGLDPSFAGERSEEGMKAFKAGLGEVNVLYANQRTDTWILQWVPKGIPRTYDDRAWPTFEKMASSMIKDAMRIITLSEDTLNYTTWHEFFELRPRRMPPLAPSAFNMIIDTKSVTSGKDIAFLKSKYDETFMDVVGTASTLWFTNLDWGDAEAAMLADLMPFCKNLVQLIVSNNRFSAKAALSLIAASVRNEPLKVMDLMSNAFESNEHALLKRAWLQAGRCESDLILGATWEVLMKTAKPNIIVVAETLGHESDDSLDHLLPCTVQRTLS